jgi:protein involved in polysaccharide export with SLBB domain
MQEHLNSRLQAGDHLYIFDRNSNRQELIEDVLKKLHTQTRKGVELSTVSIDGDIRFPGEYPLTAKMSLTSLIDIAGGLNDSSYMMSTEIIRFYSDGKSESSLKTLSTSLDDIVQERTPDVELKARDHIKIAKIPDWKKGEVIILEGEFVFPGRYVVQKGETLDKIIERAGGLTEHAHIEASFFTREFLREKEAEQLKSLRNRLAADIAGGILEKKQSDEEAGANELSDAKSLLEQLERTEPQGRLVIDLNKILKSQLREPFILKDGDRLLVPSYKQEVTVIGEVQQTSSHLYESDHSLQDYISLSGGLTSRADKKRIYVIRANGQVTLPRKRFLFGFGGVNLRPGDTVVVPLDTDRMPKLTLWSKATQVIYNAAVAAAAIGSL